MSRLRLRQATHFGYEARAQRSVVGVRVGVRAEARVRRCEALVQASERHTPEGVRRAQRAAERRGVSDLERAHTRLEYVCHHLQNAAISRGAAGGENAGWRLANPVRVALHGQGLRFDHRARRAYWVAEGDEIGVAERARLGV